METIEIAVWIAVIFAGWLLYKHLKNVDIMIKQVKEENNTIIEEFKKSNEQLKKLLEMENNE